MIILVHYRNLNDSYLEEELGIRYLDTGIDDFVANDRKMRKGEVGAFLSHYFIWKKVSVSFLSFLCVCIIILPMFSCFVILLWAMT